MPWRVIWMFAVAIVTAVAVALWGQSGTSTGLGPATPPTGAPLSPGHVQPGIPAAPEPPAPEPLTPLNVPTRVRGADGAITTAAPPRTGKGRLPTFSHVVNGEPIPPQIQQETGLSDADAQVIERETRAENTAIQTALRAFIGTLPDFRHTPEEVANASALDLMTWVAQYQPMYLEMAEVLRVMDDDAFNRFTIERRPWDEFFPDADGLVRRYAATMHEVRRATIQRIQAAGVDAVALDKLRTRYLLDGHFRLEANTPFEFGRDPGH